MIIAMYLFVTNTFIPQLGAHANAMIQPVMTIVIMLAGIVMLFGAVGFRISNTLGSTIIGGIFRAVGFIFQTIIRSIGWILRHAFGLVPQIYAGSRRTFTQIGMAPLLANILSAVLSLLVFAIII